MTSPGALDVRGGAGGIAARLDDMERAGTALRQIADGLADVAARVRWIGLDPVLLTSGAGSPLTLARAEAAAARALALIAAGAAGARALSASMLTAVALYAGAEATASGLMHHADAVAAPALALGLLAAAPWLVVLPRLGRGSLEQFAATHPWTVEHLADGLDEPVLDLLAGLGRLSPLLHEPAGITLSDGGWRPASPAAGVAGLLALVVAASSKPNTVRVERLVGADLARSWVVAIPGTQSWLPVAGASPLDLTGDVRLMAGARTSASAGVAAALDRCGARPGEPLLLVGHSQGGLVAAALAADPAFRRRFRLTHVIAAGAPIGTAQMPGEVRVLALEHADDLVPRLDGRANPDRATWVTVSARVGSGTVHPALAAHTLAGYERTAGLVDASADPSLRQWVLGLAPFLARPGASAQAMDAAIRRLSG